MTIKFTITKLIEHAERAYKEYGDIQVAIRINDSVIMSVNQVGIAGLDPEKRTLEDTYLCLAAGPSMPEVAEEPPIE